MMCSYITSSKSFESSVVQYSVVSPSCTTQKDLKILYHFQSISLGSFHNTFDISLTIEYWGAKMDQNQFLTFKAEVDCMSISALMDQSSRLFNKITCRNECIDNDKLSRDINMQKSDVYWMLMERKIRNTIYSKGDGRWSSISKELLIFMKFLPSKHQNHPLCL